MTTHPNVAREHTPRNPADYAVLGVLALGPAHGYDVSRQLHQGLEKIWRLKRSQIYALLNSLEKEGLVRHERVDQETLPPKKIFSLSPAGREVLLSWLCSPVNHIRDLRLEFLGKLHFTELICPEKKPQLVSSQLAVLCNKLNSLSEVRHRCENRLELQVLDFRLAMIRAAVQWLEGLSD